MKAQKKLCFLAVVSLCSFSYFSHENVFIEKVYYPSFFQRCYFSNRVVMIKFKVLFVNIFRHKKVSMKHFVRTVQHVIIKKGFHLNNSFSKNYDDNLFTFSRTIQHITFFYNREKSIIFSHEKVHFQQIIFFKKVNKLSV